MISGAILSMAKKTSTLVSLVDDPSLTATVVGKGFCISMWMFVVGWLSTCKDHARRCTLPETASSHLSSWTVGWKTSLRSFSFGAFGPNFRLVSGSVASLIFPTCSGWLVFYTGRSLIHHSSGFCLLVLDTKIQQHSQTPCVFFGTSWSVCQEYCFFPNRTSSSPLWRLYSDEMYFRFLPDLWFLYFGSCHVESVSQGNIFGSPFSNHGPKSGFPKECHPSLVHLDLSWALSEYATSSQSHHLEAINRNDGFRSRGVPCAPPMGWF